MAVVTQGPGGASIFERGPTWGEEAKAYVVRRDTSAVEGAELAFYLAERLATFKLPRYWEFRDALPTPPPNG